MIKMNISYLLTLRGIKKPYSFLLKNGFSNHKIYKLLRDEGKSIQYKDIEHLCVIFNCTPNDIFEWKAGGNLNVPENSPLKKLIRKPADDYSNLTKSFSPTELLKLNEQIIRIKNERIASETSNSD